MSRTGYKSGYPPCHICRSGRCHPGGSSPRQMCSEAKWDVRRAYHVFPIHPKHRWLLGMLCDGTLFIETALPFGQPQKYLQLLLTRSNMWSNNMESTFLSITSMTSSYSVHHHHRNRWQAALSFMMSIVSHRGLPLAMDKLQGPSCC